MIQQPEDRRADRQAPKQRASCFLHALRRFNAKERNFLMRYALSPKLSPQFETDLKERLKKIIGPELEPMNVVYFGMDYHLDWVHASLLVATGRLTPGDIATIHPDNDQSGKIEDADLLVVLSKADGTLVLVLIEAKGVISFSKSQIESKAKHLEKLRPPADKESEWLTTIVLLMSPNVSKPVLANLAVFKTRFEKAGFWPSKADPEFIWMELKDFFADVEDNLERPLRIRACYPDGTTAKTLEEKEKRGEYKHWHVVRRFPRFVNKSDDQTPLKACEPLKIRDVS